MKKRPLIPPYQVPVICLYLSVTSLMGIGFCTWYNTGGGVSNDR